MSTLKNKSWQIMQRRGAHDWYKTMEVQPPIFPQFLKSSQPTTNMADQHHWSTLLFCQQQPLVHFKACGECSTTHIFVSTDNTWVNSLEWTKKYIYLLQRCTAGMLTHMFLNSYTMASNLAGQLHSMPDINPYARWLHMPSIWWFFFFIIFFFHVLVVSHTCLKHTPMKFYLPYLVRATVGALSWVLSATSTTDLVQTIGLKTSFINMTDGYVRK